MRLSIFCVRDNFLIFDVGFSTVRLFQLTPFSGCLFIFPSAALTNQNFYCGFLLTFDFFCDKLKTTKNHIEVTGFKIRKEEVYGKVCNGYR